MRLRGIAILLAAIGSVALSACSEGSGGPHLVDDSVSRQVTIRPPQECQADWQMSLDTKIYAATNAPPEWKSDFADERHGTVGALEAGVVTYVDDEDGTIVRFELLTSLGPPCS